MMSALQQTFTVGDQTTLPRAVSLTLAHFGCGNGNKGSHYDRPPLVKPSYALHYRGFQVPVSLDDTSASLESRIRAYLESGGIYKR
jgi:hypothetical protein